MLIKYSDFQIDLFSLSSLPMFVLKSLKIAFLNHCFKVPIFALIIDQLVIDLKL